MTIISDMIDIEKGRKREILLRLRELNKEAYIITHGHYKKLGPKYKELQLSDTWKEAKKLLIEYFIYDGILRCFVCGNVVDSRYNVMHHTKYDFAELFTPCHIKIVHHHCHKIIHNKV